MGSRRFPLKAGPDGTQKHREMTQLTVPPPYSLVLLIQVKALNGIFGEPSSLHLDSFLLLPRERSCRFTGELPNNSLTSHLKSKWMEKESLSPPPAWHKHEESWERGPEQPLELQQQQMWHEQSPSWSYCGGGSVGPITKVWRCYSSAAGPRVRWKPGHGWFLEVWDRAWSSTLYSSPLWVDLVGFSSQCPCSKGSDQLSQKAH